jgi:predicted DsbA family dithiol-disulfide isomerase
LVHEATAFAREQGRDREFYLETAGEYWERGSDLGSIYTLRRSASRAGLDWESMWPKLESGHYRPWVLEEHRAAVEQGVKGVPSYIIGGKMYTGDVGIDALRAAVEGSPG